MTTLVVEPLYDSLEQSINLKLESRYQIGCISPYIYLRNGPSGTFTLSVIKDAITLASKSFTFADVQLDLSTTFNNMHVFYPVVFDTMLMLEKGTYSIKLTSSGYSYSEDVFIGWIRQFEDINNILDYIPASDADNPLAIRMKVYKQEIA